MQGLIWSSGSIVPSLVALEVFSSGRSELVGKGRCGQWWGHIALWELAPKLLATTTHILLA